jgi:putative ABC transport system permease protein
VIVRGGSALAAITSRLREEVRALDPDLPLFFIQTIEQGFADSDQGLLGTLFGLLAVIALVLASVVLYALTAHDVARRRHEIGIRGALGAQTSQVVWLFMRSTMLALGVGLGLGLGGALAGGKLLQAFLVHTGARDPITLVTVAALLIMVSMAATIFPAWHAARLDPAQALRRD